MNPTVEVLRKARALYEANPSHAPADEMPEPGCECPITALCTADEALGGGYLGALIALRRAAGAEANFLAEWNAEHSTDEVLAAFDTAIAAEGAK